MLTGRRQFDEHLRELRNILMEMGERVSRAIAAAVEALKTADIKLAEHVITSDRSINELEEQIAQIGTRLIATQQPVAKDLRRIMIAFKMAGDLERMGDLAVNIAKIRLRIGTEKLLKPLVDIPRMAEIVQTMTVESIQAYMEENVDLAYKMAQMDDDVDHLHNQILRELFELMQEKPQMVNQAMLLSFVSMHLERMADHATNIGESVVYLVSGTRPDLN